MGKRKRSVTQGSGDDDENSESNLVQMKVKGKSKKAKKMEANSLGQSDIVVAAAEGNSEKEIEKSKEVKPPAVATAAFAPSSSSSSLSFPLQQSKIPSEAAMAAADELPFDPTPPAHFRYNSSDQELFLGRCPPTITEDDIFSYYSCLGPDAIVSLRWAFSAEQTFKGYGFLTLRDAEVTERALELGPPCIGGRVLDVQRAGIPKADTRTRDLFLGNIPEEMTNVDIYEHYRGLGPNVVSSIKWVPNTKPGQPRAAFVTFKTISLRNAALELIPFIVSGYVLNVAKPRPKNLPSSFAEEEPAEPPEASEEGERTEGQQRQRQQRQQQQPEEGVLFLGRCPHSITDDDVHAHYEKVCGAKGVIKEIRWVMDKEDNRFRGCGFVAFKSFKLAEAASKAPPPVVEQRTLNVKLIMEKDKQQKPSFY